MHSLLPFSHSPNNPWLWHEQLEKFFQSVAEAIPNSINRLLRVQKNRRRPTSVLPSDVKEVSPFVWEHAICEAWPTWQSAGISHGDSIACEASNSDVAHQDEGEPDRAGRSAPIAAPHQLYACQRGKEPTFLPTLVRLFRRSQRRAEKRKAEGGGQITSKVFVQAWQRTKPDLGIRSTTASLIIEEAVGWHGLGQCRQKGTRPPLVSARWAGERAHFLRDIIPLPGQTP